MRQEKRSIEDLASDPSNARKHSDRNIEAIMASLRRFGQQKPIIIDKEGVVRAGNGTLEAARRIGWETIDVVVSDLTGEEMTAYAIADNRTAELAEWDLSVLQASVEALGADLQAAAGFLEGELDAIINPLGLQEPEFDLLEDEVPEPPEEPITRPGDIWELGDHLLLCGDSTREEDVRRIMQGKQADAVITDPPFGVSYTGKTKDSLPVHNDDLEGLEELLKHSLRHALEACKPGAAWYVFAPSGPQFQTFGSILTESKVWRQTLAWVKNTMVLGHSDYHYQHESIFYGWKPGGAHKWLAGRDKTTVFDDTPKKELHKLRKDELIQHIGDLMRQLASNNSTVIREDKPAASREHPTMKPLKLVARLFWNSTEKGDLVFDPFAGSGTTLVVAEQLGRKARTIEISPAYADVVVKRWEFVTGRKARHYGR